VNCSVVMPLGNGSDLGVRTRGDEIKADGFQKRFFRLKEGVHRLLYLLLEDENVKMQTSNVMYVPRSLGLDRGSH
jgi:hypothetical protein